MYFLWVNSTYFDDCSTYLAFCTAIFVLFFLFHLSYEVFSCVYWWFYVAILNNLFVIFNLFVIGVI